jgi:hypothetical protein
MLFSCRVSSATSSSQSFVSNETFYHVINFIWNESPLAIDQFDLLFLVIQSVELAIILGVIAFNES